MRTSDEILLITYEFPFGGSETFLETEIEVLAKTFSKVWVIPSRAAWVTSGSDLLCSTARRLPSNCTVVLLKRSLARSIGFAITNGWRLLSAVEFEHSTPLAMIGQVNSALREALKAILFASKLHAWISTVGAKGLGYSYWKSEAATALALLKQRGDISAFVSRCHGGDLYHEIEDRIYRPFDAFVFDRCKSVAPVSQHGCDYLIERGVDRSKVYLARLGVRLEGTSCRQSNDGILRVMSCSNAIPVKRVDLLANALSGLDIPFEWTHFGDGPELPKIRNIVKGFPTSGTAFLPGRTSNAAVLDHYRHKAVDVFVNVSSSEGVPVSIMEALAAGVPCIATDVGGTSEIVDDTCGRVLASTVTSEDLAEQIRSVVTEPENWIQRRAGARFRCLSVCSAEANYAEFCEHLRLCATDFAAEALNNAQFAQPGESDCA